MEAHHAAMQRHSLHRNADVAAADAAVAQQAAGYEFRSVDADGKTYSLRGEDRRSVHANNSSCGIDQRSAGVHRNADVAAADAAVAQQAAGYEFRSVDADGKTYSLRGEEYVLP